METGPRQTRITRPILRVLAKIVVSALLLYLLMRGRNLTALVGQIGGVNRALLSIAGVTLWCVALPSALRWSKVVEALGHRLGFKNSLRFVLIGYFFNQTLLSSVGGDGVRMWKAYKIGLPGPVAVVGVLIDRTMQYLSHMLLVTVSVPFIFYLIPDWRVRAAVLLLLAGSAIGLLVAATADRLLPGLRQLRLIQMLAPISVGLRQILLAPRRLLTAITLGLANQIGGFVAVVLLALGLGLPISPLQCLVIVPIAMLMTALPISIGGWGVREGSFIAGFGLIGVTASDALSLSVLFGLLTTAVRLPGGLIWLAVGDARAAHGSADLSAG